MSNAKSKSTNETPKFEIPNFELPKMEIPAAFRDLAEQAVSQAKDNYERLKQTAEETTGVIEKAYGAYSQGAAELTSKVLGNAQSNVNAMFDFAKSLMDVKTVAEAVEKQTSFAKTQFEILSAQGKEIQELTTKIANDTSAPIKTAAEKATKSFKKSA